MSERPSLTDWQDLSFYPGPREPGNLLWDHPDSSPLDDLYMFMAKITATFNTFPTIFGAAVEEPPVIASKHKGKRTQPAPRHVGPQGKQQFDRRGRRSF